MFFSYTSQVKSKLFIPLYWLIQHIKPGILPFSWTEADIKQAKKSKDLEVAVRIATTRERLCWIGAYYAFAACHVLGEMVGTNKDQPREFPKFWGY